MIQSFGTRAPLPEPDPLMFNHKALKWNAVASSSIWKHRVSTAERTPSRGYSTSSPPWWSGFRFDSSPFATFRN